MKTRIKAKNDFIFQRIFGSKENEDILLSLLNSILELDEESKLKEIDIIDNTKLEKKRIENKQGILDIRAKTVDGTQINIEIQLINQYNMDKRTLFYWSKMYTEQLKAGQNFNELKKTITINILDFNYIKLDKYHTKFHLREDENKEYKLTDVLEIHFIELAKFRKKKPNIKNPLERWLLFLENSSEEVLEVIRKEDPAIAKAEEVLEWLSSNEETMRLYELREKAIHDEITRIEGAREEGAENAMKKVAKNMLIDNMNIDKISKLTGLSVDIIKNIKKEITN